MKNIAKKAHEYVISFANINYLESLFRWEHLWKENPRRYSSTTNKEYLLNTENFGVEWFLCFTMLEPGQEPSSFLWVTRPSDLLICESIRFHLTSASHFISCMPTSFSWACFLRQIDFWHRLVLSRFGLFFLIRKSYLRLRNQSGKLYTSICFESLKIWTNLRSFQLT